MTIKLRIPLTFLFVLLFFAGTAQEKNSITFKRDSSILFGKCNTKENLEKSLFTKMEILPAFPGGSTKWFEFAQANLNFKDIEKDIPDSILYFNDSVIVRFVVPRAGGLCQFNFLNNPTDAIKRAVIELFKLSPDWQPGLNGNRNINGRRTLKIEVTIDREKGTSKVVRGLDHYYLTNE